MSRTLWEVAQLQRSRRRSDGYNLDSGNTCGFVSGHRSGHRESAACAARRQRRASKTMEPLCGSRALDAGLSGDSFDQRGSARPADLPTIPTPLEATARTLARSRFKPRPDRPASAGEQGLRRSVIDAGPTAVQIFTLTNGCSLTCMSSPSSSRPPMPRSSSIRRQLQRHDASIGSLLHVNVAFDRAPAEQSRRYFRFSDDPCSLRRRSADRHRLIPAPPASPPSSPSGPGGGAEEEVQEAKHRAAEQEVSEAPEVTTEPIGLFASEPSDPVAVSSSSDRARDQRGNRASSGGKSLLGTAITASPRIGLSGFRWWSLVATQAGGRRSVASPSPGRHPARLARSDLL